MSTIRVLTVDDSALMREVLAQILGRATGISVVGAANDPVRARELIEKLRPDVLTLDVEMPRMDGLTFLEQLMKTKPMPVVMVSSLTKRGSELALRALELGAIEVIEKPKLDVRAGTMERSDQLVHAVRAAAVARLKPRLQPRAPSSLKPQAGTSRRDATLRAMVPRTTARVIAVGASTGGTEAIAELLSSLPPDAPGIVIVQHMPGRFTRSFAERLDRLSRMHVKEAADQDPILPGTVLVAPGGLVSRVQRSGARYLVRVTAEEPGALHTPSVDALFESCAQAAGSAAVGVMLTGMGSDGARGLLAMRQAGAVTFAQDEASCVVFGMPKEAIARGAALHVLPLTKIGPAMVSASI